MDNSALEVRSHYPCLPAVVYGPTERPCSRRVFTAREHGTVCGYRYARCHRSPRVDSRQNCDDLSPTYARTEPILKRYTKSPVQLLAYFFLDQHAGGRRLVQFNRRAGGDHRRALRQDRPLGGLSQPLPPLDDLRRGNPPVGRRFLHPDAAG